MGKLTAIAVKAHLSTPGTYQDGEGLFLKVDKRGGAYWLLRIQRDGKRQDVGLDSAKLLTLLEARHKASGLRKAVKLDRRDVLAEKKDEIAAKVTSAQPHGNITPRTRRAGKAGYTHANGSLVSKIMLFPN
jgi:hypothetical protein